MWSMRCRRKGGPDDDVDDVVDEEEEDAARLLALRETSRGWFWPCGGPKAQATFVASKNKSTTIVHIS